MVTMRTTVLVVLLTVSVAVIACTARTPTPSDGPPSASPTVAVDSGVEDRATRTFAVGPNVTVVAGTFAGNIEIVRGPAGTVTADVTKLAYVRDADAARRELSNVAVSLEQHDAVVRITATPSAALTPTTVAHVRIAVPMGATLDLTDTSGNISIVGVDQVTVSANARTGNITFSGALGYGQHDLHVGAGAVSVTLPSDASFAIDATVTKGSVKSQFVLARVDRESANAFIGLVGPNPQTLLQIAVDTGAIELIAGPAPD